MSLLRPVLLLGALAALALPAAARAGVVAADPAAQQITALDGTLVWVSGAFGAQTLMQRTPDGAVARVPGAPTARYYASIDLGRTTGGDVVLTYLRCTSPGVCVARRDDLHGHRASVRGLAPWRGCAPSTAPAIWRDRVAYGLSCRTRSRAGLYVKTGVRTPYHSPLPADARRYGADVPTSVDLRGDRVAAVVADIYEYAFAQTATGRGRVAFLAAASEGESDEHARGLVAGPGGVLWALTDAEHAGDPNLSIVHRATAACHQWQTLANPPGPEQESGWRATDVAVDGDTVYLLVPGEGIAEHAFVPEHAC